MARPFRLRFETEEPEDQSGEDRRTLSLFGFAVALALVVLCLFLVEHLRASARLEDCLLAGRSNCDAVIAGR